MYVKVDIDIADVLDEIDTDDLVKELERRGKHQREVIMTPTEFEWLETYLLRGHIQDALCLIEAVRPKVRKAENSAARANQQAHTHHH